MRQPLFLYGSSETSFKKVNVEKEQGRQWNPGYGQIDIVEKAYLFAARRVPAIGPHGPIL